MAGTGRPGVSRNAMPRRQRWTPVKGTGTRVASPAERALLAAADLPLRVLGRAPVLAGPPLDRDRVREVLVLRLDRIGDLLMSLPALSDLRRAYPEARIRLAVGRWSEEIARRAPVDDVLVWSAPWVGRPSEGAQTRRALWRRALGLRTDRLDLALDLHTADDRARARGVLAAQGLDGLRPLVGLHASGGRPVKQWAPARWREVAARLQREFGAAFVLTGTAADRPLAEQVAQGLGGAVRDLTGRLPLIDALAVIGALDLFLSADTGPMHMAAAVGTPSVSVFGPSDARRYFSGGTGAPGTRHVVAQADLWCAPCNLIRRPPEECLGPDGPECLR